MRRMISILAGSGLLCISTAVTAQTAAPAPGQPPPPSHDAGNAGSPSRQPPGENRDRRVERTGEEGDPEQLEKWKANATRITLADGEPKSLTLKLNQ